MATVCEMESATYRTPAARSMASPCGPARLAPVPTKVVTAPLGDCFRMVPGLP